MNISENFSTIFNVLLSQAMEKISANLAIDSVLILIFGLLSAGIITFLIKGRHWIIKNDGEFVFFAGGIFAFVFGIIAMQTLDDFLWCYYSPLTWAVNSAVNALQHI